MASQAGLESESAALCGALYVTEGQGDVLQVCYGRCGDTWAALISQGLFWVHTCCFSDTELHPWAWQ